MATNGPNWSSLPVELLKIIAECLLLDSLVEILRFRAVCRSFRCSTSDFYPPKTLIPLIPRYFSVDSTHGHGCNFILAKSTIYAIQPLDRISDSHGTPLIWMVRMEESSPGKVRIYDPMAGYRCKNLPNKLPQSLNLLDYRVREIATAYQLVELDDKRKIRSRVFRDERDEVVPKFFRKVVVSVDGFAVMAVMAVHRMTGELVVWREGDKKWTDIVDTGVGHFVDTVCYHEKFYGLGSNGLTIVVEYKSLSINKVEKPHRDFVGHNLVKSFTDLLMIGFVKNFRRWEFYKLDEEKCEWVPVMHKFEDRVWFAGNDWSCSLSAKELFGFEGNCVYIHSLLWRTYMIDYPGMLVNSGCGTRICDLKYEVSGPACTPLSNIFWPPPTWLKKHSRLVPSPSHRSRRRS